MSFSLTILGSSSALPKPDRFTTAHVLNAHERFFLIDCGEGTQIQLRKLRFRFGKIHHIFISHAHGDHFFGLFGLLSSMSLMGRRVPLYIYAPGKIQEIIESLFKKMGDKPKFPIVFHQLNMNHTGCILETKKLLVDTVPLDHKTPTVGFIFREKETGLNLDRSKVLSLHLSLSEIARLKAGYNVEREDSSVLDVKELSLPPQKLRSYAFVSDTRFSTEIIDSIKNVDLLYHEATYGHEMKERAWLTGHSTAVEAAQIAKMADVGKLIIGHFSSRYKSPDMLLEQACKVFPNTELAFDGAQFDVDNS